LADRAIVNAATTLLDSPAHEARGLAFRAMSSKDKAASRIGFEFRLFKREGTLGYAPSSAAGQDYTVSAMGLDIVPVEMADPLYRRLHKTEAAP
jgi:cyanophycinase